MSGRLTCGCPGEPPGIPCAEVRQDGEGDPREVAFGAEEEELRLCGRRALAHDDGEVEPGADGLRDAAKAGKVSADTLNRFAREGRRLTLLGNRRDRVATQEDLLCDVCRARGCPTITPENAMIRNARAAAAMTAPF